jgi:Icc-related predicted phosphoesterase
MMKARDDLADFKAIRNGDRLFSPEDSIRIHKRSVSFLIDALGTPYDGPTVVVTHHLPSSMSIAPRFTNDPLNPSFASRLEYLVEQAQPRLWVHGHTHEACDYELFNTRVICNPRGYPGERQQQPYRPELIVEI